MADDPRWAKIASLMEGALARPPEERLTWLGQACPDDTVRAEVVRLLEAHEKTGSILERPVSAAFKAMSMVSASPASMMR